MSIEFAHHPVLLTEALDHLSLRPGSLVVDGTLGGGGHAAAVLENTSPDGILIGLDVDGDALVAAASRLAHYGDRFVSRQASFRNLAQVLASLGIERVDAVLLDLGVSSYQLDESVRGFRFGGDAEHTPLDMRMDQNNGAPASQLLADASEPELVRWLREYGELRGAHRLARTIVRARNEQPIETAADLLRVIHEARVGGGRKHNPATLVFQALRIAVNDELETLRIGLEVAIRALGPGGRIVVLAYHSLEDRIVKHTFRAAARGCICAPDIPVCICGRLPTLRVVTRRPIRAPEAEVTANPRARSARLRSAERLEDAA